MIWGRTSVLILIYSIDYNLAISCPKGTHSFPPDSCVSLQQSLDTFQASGEGCKNEQQDGLAVLTDEQLTGILQTYASSVLRAGQLLWIGYSYNGNSDLVTNRDANSMVVTSGPLAQDSNFNTSQSIGTSGSPCVAMDYSGTFYRRTCSMKYMSLCQKKFEAPRATLSIQGGSSRFVSPPTDITLSCNVSGTDVAVAWLVSNPANSKPMSIGTSGNSLTISSVSSSNAGSYYCVATNSLGAFVSDPVTLEARSGSDVSIPATTLSSSPSGSAISFNTGFSLTCSYNISGEMLSRVQWFVNGRPVSGVAGGGDTSMFSVDNLVEDGYYQCFVLTQNGDVSGASLQVYPQPGKPGPVDVLIVEPMSNTSLSVSWQCPQAPGTHDPILLNYQVMFHQGVNYISNATLSSLQVRAVDGGVTPRRCLVTGVITELLPGTPYAVKVQANTGSTSGDVGQQSAVASTFGLPPGPVQELKVFRTEDNKTIYGFWENVKTEPPVGMVEQYHVQYREFTKKSINSVFISREFNYITIVNVINGNSYEVRVRAGVLSGSSPVSYIYGEFSSWERVQGITTEPTTKNTGGLSPRRAGTIAAGVIVAFFVIAAILTILIAGVVCLLLKRGDDSPRWSTLGRSRKASFQEELSQPMSDEKTS